MPERPSWVTPSVVRGVRWGAVAAWAVTFVLDSYERGLHFDRTGLLFWFALGLLAASIGKRRIWFVVVDFAPFAAVLVAYDLLRGAADTLGMPTWWQPQVDVDKFLFGGAEPTVWLQEHLKHRDVRWYDVVVCLCYISFFFLPYACAAVFWLRSRWEFYRWAIRFVALSFLGFALFALVPAAPPWAAAKCMPNLVANHPSDPICLDYRSAAGVQNGGLLGSLHHVAPGANPYIERIAYRGFGELHLKAAGSLLQEGQGAVDQVAAVPSLHAAGTLLFVLFVWGRANRPWRAVLALYPPLMAFSLVYSAEHYVSDVLAGWLLALLVHVGASRLERSARGQRWAKRLSGPDTLGSQPQPVPQSEPAVESQCLPIDPLPALPPFGLPPGMTPPST
ncbi:phosphatase PAP2 family protein [Jatrophihabitans sp.]|uniref:phosphatase PAP2 family protein n=1 Tax=Jatrophihabitans sp. TaxID=1932789 RepID=UPI0030C70881|nr:superfamily protein [Jatrophihabitans sp.]